MRSWSARLAQGREAWTLVQPGFWPGVRLALLVAALGWVAGDTQVTPAASVPSRVPASIHAATAVTPSPLRKPRPGVAPISPADAARFLTQSTFGPTLSDIDRVRQLGYPGWLNEQFAATPSCQLDYLAGLGETRVYEMGQAARIEAWFQGALGGRDAFVPARLHQDQLRQRVAFALSQILVVSDQNATLERYNYALASYYDTLTRHAFGNYRDLLEAVTLHPAMGIYLSMLGNQKADPARNIRPDENFAREVMQLFSVGLVRLHPDGTPVLDGNGEAIPTYGQDTVRGFASVFTGWTFSGCGASSFDDCWYYDARDSSWRTPMVPFADRHASAGDKQLLAYPGVAFAGGVLTGGGTAASDLKAGLDNLFRHPNVGPFLGRQLIQRLVTSNPSPGYVARVAAAFDDNGAGVRGDMKAVVRAILFDAEARSATDRPAYFGKVREPILRLTHGWRALDARTRTGRTSELSPDTYLGQAPLRAPSVFNFFSPRYMPSGELTQLRLVAPELQLATDSMIPATQNAFGDEVFVYYIGNPNVGPDDISVDLSRDMPLAADPAALVDRYDLLFLSGQMSLRLRATLLARLAQVPNANGGRDRVQEALFLVMNSPEYTVQK